MGRHSIKTGYEYLPVNTDVQDTNPLMGLDTYSGQFSRPAGAAANAQLFNLADFMFGARSQYEFADLLVVNMRQRLHYAYVQDDFRVNQNLTLNLGVRYEFATPYFEDQNRLSNYDPVTNSIIQAREGSLYDRRWLIRTGTTLGRASDSPRTLNDKTGDSGWLRHRLFHFNRLGSADLLATNFPQITRAQCNAGSLRWRVCSGSSLCGKLLPSDTGWLSDGLPNNVMLYIPRDRRTPYIQNWQLSIQRELIVEYADRCCLCRQSRTQDGSAGGFKPGASSTPLNLRCRRRSGQRWTRAARFRDFDRSRRFFRRRFRTTTHFSSSSSAVFRRGSTRSIPLPGRKRLTMSARCSKNPRAIQGIHRMFMIFVRTADLELTISRSTTPLQSSGKYQLAVDVRTG